MLEAEIAVLEAALAETEQARTRLLVTVQLTLLQSNAQILKRFVRAKDQVYDTYAKPIVDKVKADSKTQIVTWYGHLRDTLDLKGLVVVQMKGKGSFRVE